MLHSRKRSCRTFLRIHIIAQPPWGFAGGLRPCAGVCFVVARIIYALIAVINNSGVENRVGRRGEAPQAKPQNERPARVEGRSSVAGGATPPLVPTRPTPTARLDTKHC